jgi:hypothetical protein
MIHWKDIFDHSPLLAYGMVVDSIDGWVQSLPFIVKALLVLGPIWTAGIFGYVGLKSDINNNLLAAQRGSSDVMATIMVVKTQVDTAAQERERILTMITRRCERLEDRVNSGGKP